MGCEGPGGQAFGGNMLSVLGSGTLEARTIYSSLHFPLEPWLRYNRAPKELKEHNRKY